MLVVVGKTIGSTTTRLNKNSDSHLHSAVRHHVLTFVMGLQERWCEGRQSQRSKRRGGERRPRSPHGPLRGGGRKMNEQENTHNDGQQHTTKQSLHICEFLFLLDGFRRGKSEGKETGRNIFSRRNAFLLRSSCSPQWSAKCLRLRLVSSLYFPCFCVPLYIRK